MKTLWVDAVRKFLRSLYIGDFKECIILHPVSGLLFGCSYKTEAGTEAMWEREDSKIRVLYQ